MFTESKKELSLLITFLYTKVLMKLTKDILTIGATFFSNFLVLLINCVTIFKCNTKIRGTASEGA